jgi:4-aminobutyrate aminotransferase
VPRSGVIGDDRQKVQARSMDSLPMTDAEFIGSAGKTRFHSFAPMRGDGWLLEDSRGHRCIDFSASCGVAALGYRNRSVAAAVVAEASKLDISCLSTAPHQQSTLLATRLCGLVPGHHHKKAIFATTGSEAVDYAISLARSYTGRRNIIAFEGSYHGATAGSAGVSGHAALRYARNADTHLFAYPAKDSVDPPMEHVLRDLENFILTAKATVAAVVVEIIQSDAGARVPADGFLEALACLCTQSRVLLIVDEVKTGLGRTGAALATTATGIVPDMLVLGKALGAGLPLAAVVGRAAIMDTPILCASTLSGSNVLCAAGNVLLDAIATDDLLGHVQARGAQLVAELRALQSPVIRNVRGRGLMVGVELDDAPGGNLRAAEIASAVAFRAAQLGLIVLFSGAENNVIDITPPLIIDEASITEGVNIIAQALRELLAGEFDFDQLEGFTGWGAAEI